MENLVIYIVENYIWFMIGFSVFIMVIVGYIADKTNFWQKETKKHKPKKVEEPLQQEGPTPEELESLKNKTLSDVISPSNSIEEVVSNEVVPNINNLSEEDLNAPFGESINSVNSDYNVSEDLSVPLGEPLTTNTLNDNDFSQNAFEDLNVPFGDNNTNNYEVNNNEDLNVPFGDNTDSKEQKDYNEIDNSLTEDIVSEPRTIDDYSIQEPIEELYKSNDSEPEKSLEELISESSSNDTNYYEPLVPEVITEQITPDIEKSTVLKVDNPIQEKEPVESEEDIWKF